MSLSKVRKASRTAHRHVKDGLWVASAVVEKAALVYSLTHPLLQQAFDTRALDSGPLDGYEKYQTMRELAIKTDGIVK